mgnify:CR=1 FL=1
MRSSVAAKNKSEMPSAQGPSKCSFGSLLQLFRDASTAHQYDRQCIQVETLAATFAQTGYPAAEALEGVPVSIAFLADVLKSSHEDEAARAATPRVEAALIALIDGCRRPLVCTTLNDQRIHLDALRHMTEAVAGALSIKGFPSVRGQATTVLRATFLRIRAQCGDDLNDHSTLKNTFQRRKDWHLAISDPVVRGLTDAWNSAVSVEAETILRRSVERVRANGSGEQFPRQTSSQEASDDEAEDDASYSARTATGESSAGAAAAEVVLICKAIIELTHYQHTTQVLLRCGTPNLLLSTLRHCEAGDRRAPLCIEMAWNVLTLAPQEWSPALGTRDFLECMFCILRFTLSVGHKLKERELRNDIIVLLGLLADDRDSVRRVTADMLRQILLLSCGAERGIASADVNPKYHHTTHGEDLQLKKLCWHLLVKFAREPELASSIFSWGFFEVLLMFVNVRCEMPCVVAWSTLQLFDLQATVLHVLIELIGTGATHFTSCGGPQILRDYIAECPRQDLRNTAVALFARGAQTAIRKDLVAVGCVAMSIALLRDATDYAVRIDCLQTLADSVDRDPVLQAQFGNFDGLSVVLPLLCLRPTHYTDKLDTLVFACVDCVWSCCFGCPENERALTEAGGIGLLLNVLEASPIWMLPLPLSCLSDILQNSLATQECRLWRSTSTGRSAVQVLLSIWERHVADPQTAPPSLDSQRSDSATAAPSSTELSVSRRIARVALEEPPTDVGQLSRTHSLCFKLYSVLCVVGFNAHNELDAKERATLASVEQFVALCKDEIWSMVESSLADANVRPATPDAMTLRTLRREADLRSLTLRTTRRAFEDIHTRQGEEAESTFYKSLIKKMDEKKGTSGKVPGIGLSITEAKIRKAQMLKQSLKDEHSRAIARATEIDVPDDRAAQSTRQATLEEDAKASRQAPSDDKLERWGIGQRAMLESEYEILEALNLVRTKPKQLIPQIQEKMKHFNEACSSIYVPGRDPETCVEGRAVYEDAISYLETVRPVVTLLDVPMGMLLAARDHVKDLGRQMKVSTTGSDGSTPLARLKRYGECNGRSQQLIALGQRSAMDIVMQLIIDDGVASRIDRKTIFDPAVRVCGVSVGPNSIYGHVAVLMLAYEYQDFDIEQQMETHNALP